MRVVHDARHARHAPRRFLLRGEVAESPERPERAEALLGAACAAGHEIVEPQACGPAPRAAVHTPEYRDFLERAWREWRALPGASEEVLPNVHPARAPATRPSAIVGLAGWHLADGACPIGEHTFDAACAAAGTAVHAAALVAGGARAAYALCRPPGHHAFADMAGGFCFLNNTAIAAEWLRPRAGRVAVLDVDVHHGNGTQSIFYRRADVLHVSIHADPRAYYPFFWGHAHERGEGSGEGYNLNVPLPVGTGDAHYLDALASTLPTIRTFAPDVLVVALGLDAFEGDPLKGMTITTDGFARIGEVIGALDLPSVLIQEGGYPCPELGANLARFLGGFETNAR